MLFGFATQTEEPSATLSSLTVPSIDINSPNPAADHGAPLPSPTLTVTPGRPGVTDQGAPNIGEGVVFSDGPWNAERATGGTTEVGTSAHGAGPGGSGHLQVPPHVAEIAGGDIPAGHSDATLPQNTESISILVPGQQTVDGSEANVLVVKAKTDAEVAEEMLTDKEKNKLAKDEGSFFSSPDSSDDLHTGDPLAKVDKKLTKMIKAESKLSRQTLSKGLKELAELQGRHRAAMADETRASAAHNKALTSASKGEAAYHAAKTRWEKQKVEVICKQEALEAARKRSKEAKDRVDDARKVVEGIREGRIADEVGDIFCL